MLEKVSTMDVRARIGNMLDRVALRHDEFIIERKGQPLAALVPVERLEQMRRFARQHALEALERQERGRGNSLSDDEAMDVALEAQRAAPGPPPRDEDPTEALQEEVVVRALLDANVLISAAIRPSGPPGKIIVALLMRYAFELVISPRIISEVETALRLPRIRKYLRAPDEALSWLADLVALADLVTDTGRVKGACRDPDDDAALAAAIEGRATAIVTGDADLIVLGEYQDIPIVTPRAFLGMIET